MNGTVMLPEFSDVSAAKAAVGALFGWRCGNQVSEVLFNVRLNSGAGALEVTKSLKFIGYELIIWWTLQG